MALKNVLHRATDEKMVEVAYQGEIQLATKLKIKQMCLDSEIECDCITKIGAIRTDGLIRVRTNNGDIAILLEAKYKQGLDSKEKIVKVLCQVCNYMNRLKVTFDIEPQLIVIGDIDSCYIIDSSVLRDYYTSDEFIYDSNASQQWENTPELYNWLMKDTNIDLEISKIIHPKDIGVDKSFRAKLGSKIQNIFEDRKFISLKMDSSRLSELFLSFCGIINDINISNRKAIELFVRFIKEPDRYNIREINKQFGYYKDDKGSIQKVIVDVNSELFGIGDFNGEDYGIFVEEFNRFKSSYSSLKSEERRYFEQNCDILIENVDRRRKGDFYTPKIWVDEAHKMISEEFGENWKDTHIVWDCACGTKNLTRDYVFGENNRNLISTTLSENDINIANDLNTGCASFKYDFLNDDVELFESLQQLKNAGRELTLEDFKDSKLYKNGGKEFIQRLLSGEQLMFFINPPYATSGNKSVKSNNGEHKTGVGNNKISDIIKRDKLGASSQQLFALFMYRIELIRRLFNVKTSMCMFSSASVCYSVSFEGMRKYISNLSITKAFMLNAGEFDGCKDNWGITFTIWKDSDSKAESLIVKKNNNGCVEDVGNCKLYNLDGKTTLFNYARETVANVEKLNALNLSSPLKVANAKNLRGKLTEKAIGYYYSGGNNIESNLSDTYILTASSQNNYGVSIEESNFIRCVLAFTVHKLIIPKWFNSKNEYMIPDIENKEYNQFVVDSIIYSIFNASSNQSSLRGIHFDGKEWNVINHFFWMSKQEIRDLAIENNNQEIIEDIDTYGIDNRFIGKPYYDERFVYNLIKQIEESEDKSFSPDAQKVLDKARDIVRKSFKHRRVMEKLDASTLKDFGIRGNKLDGEDWHINTWDAGWYQIKGLAQLSCKEELEEFKKLYKDLENRMRPLVYELGFLYK